jgi:hypothetical protein
MAKNRISTDRFGNAYQLIGCKPNKAGFSVGYIELGGKLYKIEPSEAQKEGVSHWVKVTKVDKKAQHTSM